MLSIRAENVGDAVVLRCVGRIVAGDPTRALRDAGDVSGGEASCRA